MKLIVILAASFLFAATIKAQPSPLEHYLESGKTIVIAKCLSVGPVNILLRANVHIQILHVVKGKETLREITIESQFGMKEGETYLLKTENEAGSDERYFTVKDSESAVALAGYEDIEELKKMSPRIVVLRIMNGRVEHLESEIRRINYELEALKASHKEN